MRRVSPAWLLVPVLALFAFVRSGARILPRQRVRVDASGDGHFGAVRAGHVHEGVDLLADPGEVVSSPVDGTFIAAGFAYKGDTRYRVLAIRGATHRWDLMYVRPFGFLEPGVAVHRGEAIGVAQDIVAKYGPPMLAHVHVETRDRSGALVDPETLLAMDGLA